MKRIEDERVIAEKRRINSNAFGICFLALWGILLFRQFILQQDVSEYMDIFLLTIGLSIYVTVNSVFKGLYLTYRTREMRKRINIISALTGSTVFIITQFFIFRYDITYWKDVAKLGSSFIIFFLVWIFSQSILLRISENKANKDIEE